MALNISIAGVAWYRREDWLQIVAVMDDGDKLPATYEKWLYRAENTVKTFERQGVIVYRVEIDPGTFPAWCKSHGLNVDAKARMEFANVHAAGMHRQKH